MKRNQCKIKKKHEFSFCFKHGKKVSTSDLICYSAPSKGVCVKVGFVVSKKIGGAVTRNRTKRRLSEAFFQTAADLKPLSLVFIPNPEIKEKSFEEIKTQMRNIFKKGGMLWEIKQ